MYEIISSMDYAYVEAQTNVALRCGFKLAQPLTVTKLEYNDVLYTQALIKED